MIRSQCTLGSSPAQIQFDLPPYLSGLPAACSGSVIQASLPGDNRALEPPESIPNSEVKRSSADGSAGFPRVRVGRRQALNERGLAQRLVAKNKATNGFFIMSPE